MANLSIRKTAMRNVLLGGRHQMCVYPADGIEFEIYPGMFVTVETQYGKSPVNDTCILTDDTKITLRAKTQKYMDDFFDKVAKYVKVHDRLNEKKRYLMTPYASPKKSGNMLQENKVDIHFRWQDLVYHTDFANLFVPNKAQIQDLLAQF
jgi:hypothetical protein